MRKKKKIEEKSTKSNIEAFVIASVFVLFFRHQEQKGRRVDESRGRKRKKKEKKLGFLLCVFLEMDEPKDHKSVFLFRIHGTQKQAT